MEVRRGTTQDAGALVEVLAAIAEEGGFILTEPPLDLDALHERFVRELADGAAATRVLVDDGAIVGSAAVTPTPARGVLSLGMGILGPWRGRGGGRRLLEAAVDDARALGAHKVELEVFPQNGRAVALYAAGGFAVEGVREAHHRRNDGSLRTTLLMARRL